MIKVFHSFSSGITLAMLYVFAVFMTPVFTAARGQSC